MNLSPPASSVHGIFPGKNTGMGCHFLLQGIFPTQESNPCLLCLLHWQVDSLPLVPPGKPISYDITINDWSFIQYVTTLVVENLHSVWYIRFEVTALHHSKQNSMNKACHHGLWAERSYKARVDSYPSLTNWFRRMLSKSSSSSWRMVTFGSNVSLLGGSLWQSLLVGCGCFAASKNKPIILWPWLVEGQWEMLCNRMPLKVLILTNIFYSLIHASLSPGVCYPCLGFVL